MDVVDVVVIGSGAAGLTAALAAADAGAEVVVLEASPRWGGSTAVSGGQVWAPANHRMAEAGFGDSIEEALTYCRAAAPCRDADLVGTFVRSAAVAVRFVEDHSPIRFATMSACPDTFAEFSGGKTARHLEVEPVAIGDLGALEDLVWPGAFPPVLTNQEVFEHRLFIGGQPPMELIGRRMSERVVTLGAGLIVGLLHGCRQAGVDMIRNCRVRGLDRDPDGRVVGVTAEHDGTVRALSARRAVVLACGGFEHDTALRSQLLSGPLTHPVSPPVQHGDGLRMAAQVGAALAYTGEYWSWPVCELPGRSWPDPAATAQSQLVVPERSLPHVLWVNGAGVRFVNESSHNCAASFAELDPNTHCLRNLPAWAIGDAQFRAKYAVAGVPPGTPAPEWLIEADTLDGLAKAIDVDATALRQTVTRFNAMAEFECDEDFHRGETRYERAYGDPTARHPNLGTVAQPPFFALAIQPGAVGTKGGPRTDHRARVLDWSGRAIPGLYAAGNVAAAVFGPGTIAGGVTIASALTWGWTAGRDAMAT